MRTTLFVHILAGSLALVAGYVALYSPKGASLHRRSGTAFAYAMLVMATMGLVITLARDVALEINVPAALLSVYLVITSLLAVRPPEARRARWLHPALMLVVASVALVCLAFGFETLASGQTSGMSAFPFFMFGGVGLLATLGDLRMIRAGGLHGARRVARHLWRMSFALFIAAMSFFLGQAKVIPEPIRIPALLAVPVLAVLVTMLYWLWRVRVRRSLRGLVQRAAPLGAPRPAPVAPASLRDA